MSVEGGGLPMPRKNTPPPLRPFFVNTSRGTLKAPRHKFRQGSHSLRSTSLRATTPYLLRKQLAVTPLPQRRLSCNAHLSDTVVRLLRHPPSSHRKRNLVEPEIEPPSFIHPTRSRAHTHLSPDFRIWRCSFFFLLKLPSSASVSQPRKVGFAARPVFVRAAKFTSEAEEEEEEEEEKGRGLTPTGNGWRGGHFSVCSTGSTILHFFLCVFLLRRFFLVLRLECCAVHERHFRWRCRRLMCCGVGISMRLWVCAV